LLLLNFVMIGCQGIAPGGGRDLTHGTLSVTPASLSFGDVTLGKTASLKGSLSAAGSPVTVSSVSSSSAEFAVSGISFPVALNVGQSLPFNVTFTPEASGGAIATLTFTSDAIGSSWVQSVNGTGVPAPQHSVDLSWNASQSAGVVGYHVYRGIKTGGPYSRINVALEASTFYTDPGLIGGTGYYYVVTAVDGNTHESGYSNEAQVAIPAP
jgi:hypothetical protein